MVGVTVYSCTAIRDVGFDCSEFYGASLQFYSAGTWDTFKLDINIPNTHRLVCYIDHKIGLDGVEE